MSGRGSKTLGMTGAAVAAALFAAACSGPAATGATSAATATAGSPASSASASGLAVPAPSATAASTAPASPTPSASVAGAVSPMPSATTESCASYAASHTFAQLTAAKENSDGSVAITAHRATVVCGGPDDMHYNVATATETGTVTPAATVQMLTGVVKEQTVAHADVSARLAQDKWGRIFMLKGPLTSISALTEMYHP
jgi:hypothetical protein